MNYRDFHGDGDFMAVHFIIDQSRNEPPYRRATLMMDACAFFKDDTAKEASDELYALATECFDCEQEVQRFIGGIRSQNAQAIESNAAVAFMLTKIEAADLRTKLDLLENVPNLGLSVSGRESAIAHARERIVAFEQRFDLFLFRVRTHHWRTSNSETIAREQSATSVPYPFLVCTEPAFGSVLCCVLSLWT